MLEGRPGQFGYNGASNKSDNPKVDEGFAVGGVYPCDKGRMSPLWNNAESNKSKLGEFAVGGVYPSGIGRMGPLFSNNGAGPEVSRVEKTSYGWLSNGLGKGSDVASNGLGGGSDVSLVVMKSIGVKVVRVVSSKDLQAGLDSEGPGLGVPFPAASAEQNNQWSCITSCELSTHERHALRILHMAS